MTLVPRKTTVKNAVLMVAGCLLFALGIDCFAVPAGLAAGGLTGLATIVYYLGLERGVTIPVGTQVLVMNCFLMIPVLRQGGWRYARLTVLGIILSSVFMDLLAPLVPTPGGGDLLLCALWGGVLCGVGLGMVFRTGGNTGGVDIIAQLLSKPLQMPIGTLSIIIDVLVIAVSIPVLGLTNSLYATIMMVLCGVVIDAVIDGPKSERAVWIVSREHAKIANAVLYDLGRGVTELTGRGVWSGNGQPVLWVVLRKREVQSLKALVASIDPEALVVISDVHEVFGEGFTRIN